MSTARRLRGEGVRAGRGFTRGVEVEVEVEERGGMAALTAGAVRVLQARGWVGTTASPTTRSSPAAFMKAPAGVTRCGKPVVHQHVQQREGEVPVRHHLLRPPRSEHAVGAQRPQCLRQGCCFPSSHHCFSEIRYDGVRTRVTRNA